MKGKLIFCRGISASGKTTFSKQYVKDNPGSLQVSKDEIRDMLHDGKWSQGNEKIVCDTRDAIIKAALHAGRTVISADTNFAPAHEARLRQIASEEKATFEIKDFPIDFETAVERDLKREHPVGYDVIKDQWDLYIRPTLKVKQDEALPKAWIFDLDGTLAIIGDRSPYDSSTCLNDTPNELVVSLFKVVKASSTKTIICSGRENKYRLETERWLKVHGIVPDLLLMRMTEDNRKDSIVKEELFRQIILPVYHTELVVDDRDQVVRMWRDLGLTCWQVADGHF